VAEGQAREEERGNHNAHIHAAEGERREIAVFFKIK
jgi:hypothetical protein